MIVEEAKVLLGEVEKKEKAMKVETKQLNELLRKMSAKEFMKFRTETGY